MKRNFHSYLGLFFLLLFVIAGLLVYNGLDRRIDVPDSIKPRLQTTVDPAVCLKVQESLGKIPLHFEANQGQTDPRVKFIAKAPGFTVFYTADGPVMAWLEEEGANKSPASNSLERPKFGDEDMEPSPMAPGRARVLRMTLSGSNASPEIEGLEELPGKVNYFKGNEPDKWRTNIPTYGKVRYKEVYPGIDVVYHGNPGQMEYDFVVSPGADPNVIKLAFDGADKVALDDSGNLVIEIGREKMIQHAPVVYQEIDGQRRELTAGNILQEDNKVSFLTAGYDRDKPLIIDPIVTLVWSTYLGGSKSTTSVYAGDQRPPDEAGLGMAVDASGNVYVTGYSFCIDFPLVNNIYELHGCSNDVFVTKISADGTSIIFSTYLGGLSPLLPSMCGWELITNNVGRGVAVDGSGNVYVTGETNSYEFPMVNAILGYNGGVPYNGIREQDGFVTKLNSTGSALVYSTYLGGTGTDKAYDIAVDSSRNAYITGITFTGNFPAVNAIQGSISGGSDAFVTKINEAGSAFVYSTYLGGSGADWGNGIAVDAAGNAYVTGYTKSTDFPTANALQGSYSGSKDAFVTKINAAGTALVYSTYLGGSGVDYSNGIAVEAAGNAYVTGYTESTNFPTANALQGSKGGGGDAFVTKINAAGSALVYSTYLGGSGDDEGYGIAVDADGNVYVTGHSISTNFPMLNAIQGSYSGNTDAFVTKINSDGSALVYSTYLGGPGLDSGYGIAVDAAGNACVTGYTKSTNFPTVNAIQGLNAGSADAFVTKLTLGARINAAADPGGSIAPSGAVGVVSGANQAFIITPNGGCQVWDVVVDGVSQGAVTNYTFTNVTADHTISATFDPIVNTGFVIGSHGSLGYTPGVSAAISVEIQSTAILNDLTLSIILPSGWSFISATGGGAPTSTPPPGASGTLNFAWSTIPSSPIRFTYQVSVPAWVAETQSISGLIFYRTTGSQEMASLSPNPLNLNPYGGYHSSDYNPRDWRINMSELLRSVIFFNMGGYHCDPGGEDGFSPGPLASAQTCVRHSLDYSPTDWRISLSELLRLIQFHNLDGYHVDATSEGGFAPGLAGSPDAGSGEISPGQPVFAYGLSREGNNLVANLTISPQSRPSALGYRLIPPDGWSFVSVGGINSPSVGPGPDAKVLEFGWIDLPDGPVNFTLTLRPNIISSDVVLVSQLITRYSGGEQIMDLSMTAGSIAAGSGGSGGGCFISSLSER